MAESYSTSLKITLIGDGDLAGTWGDTTNTNWNLAEQAITGVDYLSAMGDANYTLTNLNGISDEARNQVIVVPSTTTLSATRYVYAPFVNKTYVISNQSAGGQAIYIQGIVSGTPTGSPLLIPNGVTTIVYCDGANGFYAGATGSAGNFLVNGNFSVTGSESATGNLTVGGNLAVTGTTTLSGSATAPTVSSTDNSTNIATTAFVKSNLSGLGTMSTQNANNVDITGGIIDNVSGTNPSLNVGYATSAGNSSTTSQTNFINLTINTNQVLDAANYNSYAPTLTGGNASGTWGINITGNAATVSNGVYNNGGTYGINITGSAGYATTAGNQGIFAQVFTSSGTFTVPTGVTSIKVTIIGGGGGGGSAYSNGYNNGNAGGSSSFGSYLTATGGGGGGGAQAQYPGPYNGSNGATGTSGGSSVNSHIQAIANGGGAGAGGVLIYCNCGPTVAATAGSGGNGGVATGFISVTPGQTISVTIGGGGSPGTYGTAGTAGSAGYCLVEW